MSFTPADKFLISPECFASWPRSFCFFNFFTYFSWCASGFTTPVSEIIKNLGYSVFESYKEIDNLFKINNVKKKIKDLFLGKINNLIKKDGSVNKSVLGSYVFLKKEELKNLEDLIYPLHDDESPNDDVPSHSDILSHAQMSSPDDMLSHNELLSQ